AIGVQRVVGVDRRRLVGAEAVDVEFLHQRDRAADDHLTHHLVVVAWSEPRGHVVRVAPLPHPIGVTGGLHGLVEGGVIGSAALVPVIRVSLVVVGVVHPLGALTVGREMVVDDVGDDGEASAVALLDEELGLVAAAAAVFDR